MTHPLVLFKMFPMLAMTIFLGHAPSTWAQTPQKQITAVQRQKMSALHKKMAEMHAQMATCLDSDKALSQCQKEMIDACSAYFGGTCPMMRKGTMGRGRGMGMMGNETCMDWMFNPDVANPKKSPPAN